MHKLIPVGKGRDFWKGDGGTECREVSVVNYQRLDPAREICRRAWKMRRCLFALFEDVHIGVVGFILRAMRQRRRWQSIAPVAGTDRWQDLTPIQYSSNLVRHLLLRRPINKNPFALPPLPPCLPRPPRPPSLDLKKPLKRPHSRLKITPQGRKHMHRGGQAGAVELDVGAVEVGQGVRFVECEGVALVFVREEVDAGEGDGVEEGGGVAVGVVTVFWGGLVRGLGGE